MRLSIPSITTTCIITLLLTACSSPADDAATAAQNEALGASSRVAPQATATATAHSNALPPPKPELTCKQIVSSCDSSPGGNGTALCRALCGEESAWCIDHHCFFP